MIPFYPSLGLKYINHGTGRIFNLFTMKKLLCMFLIWVPWGLMRKIWEFLNKLMQLVICQTLTFYELASNSLQMEAIGLCMAGFAYNLSWQTRTRPPNSKRSILQLPWIREESIQREEKSQDFLYTIKLIRKPHSIKINPSKLNE